MQHFNMNSPLEMEPLQNKIHQYRSILQNSVDSAISIENILHLYQHCVVLNICCTEKLIVVRKNKHWYGQGKPIKTFCNNNNSICFGSLSSYMSDDIG